MSKKEQSVKISFLENESDENWIFKTERIGEEAKIISVEFKAENICVSKPYQILYPVDQACDEQGDYRTDIYIMGAAVLLFDEEGYEYDSEDYDLSVDEIKLIETIIESDYEF